MSAFPYREELSIAEHAARQAGAVIMELFRGKFDVHQKSRNNPVTTADLRANQVIRETVRGRFPGDGWLSEEDVDDVRRLAAERVWVVDPIDGTKEFIEGVPQFAVSIALVVNGRPRAAIVFNPAEDRLYSAAEGTGASLNGRPVQVSGRTVIDGALLLVSRSEPRRKFQAFVDRCEIQPVGSIAYRLAKVAGGDGDGTLTFRSISEWDVCAGSLIVEEAGGEVLDGAGRPLTFNQEDIRRRGVIAANKVLAHGFQVLWQKAMAENYAAVR